MKEQFITAYQWMFGGSKKRAEAEYKQASWDYITAIIEAYNKECKLSFYND